MTMKRGPLSPVNCALYLGFVLAILFSRIVFQETLSLIQTAGVVCAVLCVLCGGFLGNSRESQQDTNHKAKQYLLYGGLLLLLFFLNASMNIALKYLAMTPNTGAMSLMTRFGNINLVSMYGTLAICLMIELLRQSLSGRTMRMAALLGLAGSVCSSLGIGLTGKLAHLPAALVFPLSAIVSILIGAIVSVSYFGEKTSHAWWCMMASGVATATLLIIDVLQAKP